MIDDQDRGIRLDIGCGRKKNPGFLGLDKRDIPEVDLVWDLESFPYPIPNDDCHVVLAKYVLEYIKPWLIVDVFNEIWRITKPGGQLVIATPYAGSDFFLADPVRCNGFTYESFSYFDRRHPLWMTHEPKPWVIDPGFPQWQNTGVIEVVMTKVREEDVRVVPREAIGGDQQAVSTGNSG